MIELPCFSMHHELLRWRQKLHDAIDRTIPIVLLVLVWLSALVVFLGGR